MKSPLRVALLMEITRGYGRGVCAGVAAYARAHGHWAFELQERILHQTFPDWLKTWQGDGIIAWIENAPAARAIARTGLPAVDLLGERSWLGIPLVHLDVDAVARLAVDYYLENGFRQFAFCGYPGLIYSDQRSQAFVRYLATKGMRPSIFHAPSTKKRGGDILSREKMGAKEQGAIASWLKRLPGPLAVLACNDVRGYQVLMACRDYGILVPDEAAVMGMSNDEVLCELADPPMSSVEQDMMRVGYRAAQVLHQMMRGKAHPHFVERIPPKRIVERQSTDVVAVGDAATRSAIRFIRKQAGGSLTVKNVLRHAGLSRTALETRFKKAFDCTIKDEIQRVRVNRVKQLLDQTDESLVAIARQTGFLSNTHMHVVFKRATGRTPGNYRKSRRQDV